MHVEITYDDYPTRGVIPNMERPVAESIAVGK
jgi:hypothetical protein